MRREAGETAIIALREIRPVVYQLTNFVSAQLQADLTALLGGCPVMTRHPGETAEVVRQSHSVLINVGTPDEGTPALCREAAREANERNIPVVLDINGCGFTAFRSDLVDALLRDFSFAVVRGNAGEIARLAKAATRKASVRGMSGRAPAETARASAAALSRKFRSTIVATGPVSYVASEDETAEAAGGDERLALLSGWGCALGSAIALFCAVEKPFGAARTALEIFRDAASRASEGASGIGSFRQRFWDELSHIAAGGREGRA